MMEELLRTSDPSPQLQSLEEKHANSTPRDDAFGLTHAGRVRDENQDHFLVAHLRKVLCVGQTSLLVPDHSRIEADREGLLLVVADGVGGRSSGEIASSVVVDTLSEYALNTMPWFMRPGDEHTGDELKEGLRRSTYLMQRIMLGDPKTDGMATTLVMAYVSDQKVCVAHLGDSRAYMLTGGRLERITRDHTIAQDMIDAGRLTEEEAAGSRWNHVLSRAVGAPNASPDVYTSDIYDDDILLLCSDGLTGHVTDREIEQVLQQSQSSEKTCQQLRDLALLRGGQDNITIVCARVTEAREEGPS